MVSKLHNNVDFSRVLNKNNFKILTNSNSGKICYIFCNSALIQPSKYTQDFVDNLPDKFEFENISSNIHIQKRASKIIFLKDVFSVFYLNGLNNKIKSIDEILDFLRFETAGYQVILCGFSAGAYLATLISSALDNVICSFTFGTVFNLKLWDGCLHTYTNEDRNFFLKNEDPLQMKYLDLVPFLQKRNFPIYYFYGVYSDADILQSNLVRENESIIKIPLKTKRHCGNLPGDVLIKILTSSPTKLERIFKNNTLHSSSYYLIRFCTIFAFIKQIFKKLIK